MFNHTFTLNIIIANMLIHPEMYFMLSSITEKMKVHEIFCTDQIRERGYVTVLPFFFGFSDGNFS